MADTLDVLTLAEAHSAINVASSVTTDDTELAAYVTAVSKYLDDLCGPIVVRTVSTERYDGGCRLIALKSHPVSSVTTVTEYSYTTATALAAETNTAKTANDYLADLDAGFLYRRSAGTDALFAEGRQNVEVTYVAGRHATTAVVAPKFKTAAAIMLANYWRREQGGGSVTFPDGSIDIPTFGLPHAARTLIADEIRRPAVA